MTVGPIEPGELAWCTITSATNPGGERYVVGAAQVRVEAVAGERCDVVVVAGYGVAAATPLTLDREELYRHDEPIERGAYDRLVSQYWGSGYRTKGTGQ